MAAATAAKLVLIASIAALASASDAACFKSKRRALDLVTGHNDRSASIYLLAAEKDEEFSQLRLQGDSTDVTNLISCDYNTPAQCNFMHDNHIKFVIEQNAGGAKLTVHNGKLRLGADPSANLTFVAASDSADRVYEFDKLADRECSEHFTPVILQFSNPPGDDDAPEVRR